MIYAITSLVNGHDNLRPPFPTALADGVRWICYTNSPHQERVDPWEFRPVYDVGHAARTSRVPKILPHLMLPEDAEFSVWMDGNFQLQRKPQEIIAECLQDADWAAHQHPGRKCIYTEGEHCAKENIGTPGLILAELGRYRAMRYPGDAGLWANGFLVRRHTPEVKALCEHWWDLYRQGGERDQISFPVAHRKSGVRMHTIQHDHWHSPYVFFNFHAPWLTRSDNEAWLPQREVVRQKLARLAELTKAGGGIKWPEK